MESSPMNCIQSQQIPCYLHKSMHKNGSQARNPYFYQNMHKSPIKLYLQLHYKKPQFFETTVSESRISYQKTQKVQSSLALVQSIFEKQFKLYNHHQKISCLINVIDMFRKLISTHGLFLLTKDHLKMDTWGRPLVLISRDDGVKTPNLYLKSNKFNEWRVVESFLDIFRKYFSAIFLKYSKIRTLQDLQHFFSSVKKRNQIHKRCKHIIQSISKSNLKTFEIVKNETHQMSASKRFDLKQRPVSYFGILKPKQNSSILSSNKKIVSQFQKIEIMKRQDSNQKSQLETTNMSYSNLRQSKSSLQIQNISKESDIKRQSCVLKSDQSQNSLWNFEKKIFMISQKKQSLLKKKLLSWKQDRNKPKPISMNAQREVEKQINNSLSICFQDVFLIRVVQDLQNEVLNSGGNKEKAQQIMKDFEHVLY